MDFWQRARSLAEEAAKRSQELTSGISVPSKLSDVVSEASKRSLEIATEASRKSKEIAAEALKRADQIKSQLPPATVALSSLVDANSPSAAPAVSEADLKKFGVTDDLRDFVKGITLNTFRDFPLEDDSEISDMPAVSNVRQDLTEFQEKHAKLVLATVKMECVWSSRSKFLHKRKTVFGYGVKVTRIKNALMWNLSVNFSSSTLFYYHLLF